MAGWVQASAVGGNPGTVNFNGGTFTNGVLSVVATMVAYPTNITATVNGSSLEITWPAPPAPGRKPKAENRHTRNKQNNNNARHPCSVIIPHLRSLIQKRAECLGALQ